MTRISNKGKRWFAALLGLLLVINSLSLLNPAVVFAAEDETAIVEDVDSEAEGDVQEEPESEEPSADEDEEVIESEDVDEEDEEEEPPASEEPAAEADPSEDGSADDTEAEVVEPEEADVPADEDVDVEDERGPPEEEEAEAAEDEEIELLAEEEEDEPELLATISKPSSGAVLCFTSDTHNMSNNTAANRLGTWLDKVSQMSQYGGITLMAFGGDMANAGAGQSDYWTFTKADMDQLDNRGVQGVYTTGNHEYSPGSYSASSSSSTQQAFKISTKGAEGDDYIVYCLGSQSSSSNYSNQKSALTSFLNSAGNDKPIFIITHFPLHYYRNRSTTGASDIIDVLNDAVTNNKQTIIFLWGHNHTMSDTYYDQIYGPGGVDSIQYGSSTSNTKTIKFYYGGAGCMSDSEYSGANTGSASVMGKGLVVKVTRNRDTTATLDFAYYNENGTNVSESNSIDSVTVTLGEDAGSGDDPSTTDEEVSVTPASSNSPEEYATIAVGDTLTINVKNGSSSSSYTFSATLSSNGIAEISPASIAIGAGETEQFTVTGLANGTVDITIQNNGQYNNRKATIHVTVGDGGSEDPPSGDSITVTPTSSNSPEESITIPVGGTYTINVVNGSSSTAYDFTATFSKDGVAQINPASANIAAGGTGTFTVTGLANGTVDITIQNNGQYSNRKATIHVTVGDGGSEPPSGEDVTYVQTDTFVDGKDYIIVNGNTGSVYVVSNTSTGSGTSTGLVGISATVVDGKITLSAADAAKAAFTCELKTSDSGSVSAWLKQGSNYLYTASSGGLRISNEQTSSSNTGKFWHYRADAALLWFFKDGSGNDGYTDSSNTYKYWLEYSGTSSVTFTSNHTTSSGTTSISDFDTPAIYIFVEDDGTQPVEVPVTGITLDKTTASVDVGKTVTLTATIAPSNATNKSVTWSSSDTTKATVDQNGKVTGVAEGTATITVTTTDGGKTATCVVTVNKVEEKTYVLTTKLVPGKNYIITSGNTGSVYALTNNNGSIAATEINVADNKITTSNADIVFTTEGSDTTVDNIGNGGVYLRASSSSLSLGASQSGRPWAYDGETNRFTCKGSNNTYYVYYSTNNNRFSVNTTASDTRIAYIFVEDDGTTPEEVHVTGVTVEPTTATLNVGETVTLTATVAPADADNKNVTWSSSNTSIATVNNGVVTAVAAGTATITVTTVDQGKTATCAVTVSEPAPGEEKTYVLTNKLTPGKNYVIATKNNGSAYVLTTDAGSVSNSLKGISVNVADGKITLSASAVTKAAFNCAQNTSSTDTNYVRLMNGGQYLYADGSGALRMASSISDNGKNWHYRNDDKPILWFFNGSDGEYGYTATGSYKYYLDYDASGNFTKGIVDNNTVLQTATTPEIYIFIEDDGSIPEPVAVTGVTLDKTEATVNVGGTITLTATVAPADADNKAVTWSSSDTTKATVDQTGKVTGVAEGTATITVTTVDGGKTATCTVTVTAASPSVDITPEASNSPEVSITIPVGGTYIINVTNSSTRSDYDFTATLSKSGIASVDPASVNIAQSSTGQFTVTGLADGKVDITIQNNNSSSNRKGIIHVTVGTGEEPPSNEPVDITPTTDHPEDSRTITVGDTLEINVKNGSSSSAYDFNATLSNSDIVEIDPTTANIAAGETATFTVTALSIGTVDITIQNESSYGSQYARQGIIHVTVVEGGTSVPVEGVSLDKETMDLLVDKTGTLKATFTPTNASNKKVTWTSSNPAVATVSTSGVVTAVAAGTATITVTTEDGGFTDTCVVTVTEPEKFRYERVYSLVDGGEYIITNNADIGADTTRALKNPGGTNSGVTISSSNGKTSVVIQTGNYIETSATDIVWTATANGDGFYLTNDGDYFEVYRQALYVFDHAQQETRYWTYTDTHLEHVGSTGNRYFVDYADGTFTAAIDESEGADVYLFKKVTGTPVNTYTVTFNTNGGSTVAAQTVEEGSTATKPADPTKEGCYAFDGWYANEGLTTAYDFNAAVTANITVYAKWVDKHTLTKVDAVAATCTATGNIEYYICSECGKYFSDEAGTTEITDKDSVITPMIAHTLVKTEAKAATCAAEGNTEYWTCSVCNKYFSDEAGTTEIEANSWILPALPHTYGDPVWTWTAIETGYTATAKFTCSECGHEESLDAEVTSQTVTETSTLYIASVTFNDTPYTDTKLVDETPVTYELDKTEATIPVDSTEQLQLIGSDGTVGTGTWTSDNETVATVDQNGLVTAHKYGKATIHVEMANGYKADCEVQTLFRDVTDGKKYYYKAVYWAADHDPAITRGYDLEYYGVGLSCSREEFILFIYRLAGQPKVSNAELNEVDNKFSDAGDLSSNSFKKAVAWGVKNGIIKGYTSGENAGKFMPGNKVTRQEALLMLWRYAGKPSSKETSLFKSFTDMSGFKKTSDTYNAIKWSVATGISKGYSQQENIPEEFRDEYTAPCFGTGISCLREDMIVFLYRYATM